ncbi:hypothetical protein Tco_1245343 [Tanacetum coccineum]
MSEAEPIPPASSVTTLLDDWSMEFDAEYVHFGQDGLGFGIESSSGMESDNSSGDETLTDHLYENFKREKAYKAVHPPQIGLIADDEGCFKTLQKLKRNCFDSETSETSFYKTGQGYKNLQKLKYPQMKELYDKVQESIKDSFKDFIPMDSEREKQMLKERDEKRLLRKRKATISEEQPSKKLKLRTETIDELRNYLRIVIDSPDGEYLIIHRANNHFRAFDTLWEILHILDRQDLYHLYRVVQDYYEHIPPTGLGLILLGDLTTIWETAEISDDDFWKNQEDWEIVRWRLNESSGVHTLELEDGTMIHMLAERRYPLSRELMIRMLDHGMEVEDESEIAIAVIHLFILWTTEDGDDS